MKSYRFAIAALLVFSIAEAFAQGDLIFPKGPPSGTAHHVGNVWLHELNAPDSTLNMGVATATFDAGARLDWHMHPGGQVLMFTDGAGYYQERGKPKQLLRKGDVVKCLPGVEHWHGATPETGVTYIASSPMQFGRTVWLERVNEADFLSKATSSIKDEQVILKLSREKWQWMADKNVDTLAKLFHPQAMFVHMGANMTKEQELDVIKTGRIHYKHTELQESSVQFIGDNAIVLNKLVLTAVVGGNEVVNPFTVTEVYLKKEDASWTLLSLSFTRLLTPPPSAPTPSSNH